MEHLGRGVPSELVAVCDVIIVNPENTYARWALPTCADGRTVNDAENAAWIAAQGQ